VSAARHPTWRSVALLLLVLTAVVGCGDDRSEPPVEPAAGEEDLVEVTAEGGEAAGMPTYSFALPDELTEGPTRFSFRNEDDEPHHAQIFRLDDDAELEDLTGALATGEATAPLEHGRFEGGTSLVAPGERSQADAVVDLVPGSYALLCFVPGQDGAPHLAHGMVQPFEVAPAADPPPEAPEADEQVQLVDYDFDLPETMSGDALLEVSNAAADEPHEMIVARLDQGADLLAVEAALAAGEDVPATPLGGLQAIQPGTSQRVPLDLPPGDHVVFCSIPSANEGVPHHALGMVDAVRIT
jgi:uncharacterized cupredoxin-like copper-binding protein